MLSNRIEITLESILGTLVLHDDPIGYDQSELEIGRSQTTYGIFLKEINNLEFTGEAKRYLESLWLLRGPQAQCMLLRKEKHPTTDEWQLKATGFLNFMTRKIKDNKFSIDFTEGGLREILTSQMREKFELDRLTDITGKAIPPLLTDTLSLQGREIYLLSKYNSNGIDEFTLKSGEWKSEESEREAFRPAPLNLVANSDPENIKETIESIGSHGQNAEGNAETKFFVVADRDRGKTKVKIKVDFRIAGVDQDGVNSPSPIMQVFLRRYTSDANNDFIVLEDTLLVHVGDPRDHVGEFFSGEFFTEDLQVKKGESFALYFYLVGAYGGDFDDGHLNVNVDAYSASISWEEDSFFRRTQGKCLTAYEVGKRLTEIYVGKPCFESQLLDGQNSILLSDASHQVVFSPGGWIRNLKREEEDDLGNVTIKEWPFEMSFEDYYKSIHAVLPVGYGIQIVGNRQNIIFEDLKFFFQRTVTVNLGKIQIKERSTAEEFCFQSLKFGYTKGGNYEKPLGLDEYNTQTATRTPLTVTDKEYEALGPSRTDSYGAEDARRKQYEDHPDEDTPYDRDNFMFDVKKIGGSIYEVRTALDDFESLPTGVYSPETAYNLNFSPGRNRERHSFFFNNALAKLHDESIQFLNSQGNSSLRTKKVGESALKENVASIPIPDLDNPIFQPEWIDAEAPFDQTILDQIQDTTLINGRRVNNYYGLAEFINEKNRTERAFIFTVKVKDKFTYKLLKAYGV